MNTVLEESILAIYNLSIGCWLSAAKKQYGIPA